MGIRDWIKRVLSKDASGAEAREALTEQIASEFVGSTNAPSTEKTARKTAAQILAPIQGLPPSQALAQCIATIETTQDSQEASVLTEHLRKMIADGALPDDTRIRMSDWFAARGESATAVKVLDPLVVLGSSHALPALVRLADMAQQRGDTPEQVRLYDEILAIDVGFPGVRERLLRLRAPTKVGEAGATLIAPESTVLGSGRFELVSELGRDGAGAVFIARDVKTRREVALKLYHANARGERNARLRSEAVVASLNACRNVVHVYDLFEDLGAITMEHCTGSTLRRVLSRNEGGVAQRRSWARGVAAALAVTHANGWAHRDLKPGNILQRADGAAVLTDFGLAAKIGSPVEPAEGTAGYTPPEARSVRTADPRADVYAFGALLRDFAGERDPEMAAYARKCLADDPSLRPRDGAELFNAVDPWIART
jgi:tRNA A-37 threonylcarbamoyl transferase component Bud32